MRILSELAARVCLAVAIGTAIAPPIARAETVDEQRVLVRIRVDNTYDDSDRSLAEIQQLLSVLPPTRGSAAAGDTVSSIIVGQYGFGPKNLPRTYEILERAILGLNKLASGNELHPGPMILPFLPKRAYTHVSPFNLGNSIPAAVEIKVQQTGAARQMPAIAALASVSAVVAQAQSELNEFARTTLLNRVSRRGAQGVLVDVELDRSLLNVQPWADFIRSAQVTISSSALVVKFADRAGSPAGPPLLSPVEEDVIRNALSTATRTRTLVVLDSGWPDQDSLTESVQFFQQLSSDIRRHYNLAPARVSWPSAARFERPIPDHCVHVKEALDELRALDPSHVRVVYLPIAVTQGSPAIINELVELHFILTNVRVPWAKWRFDRTVPSDTQLDAARHAKDVVDHLSPAGEGEFARTDSVVLDALSTVLSYVGDARNENFFINESWTVDTDVVKYAPPAIPRALVLAAAGNDGKDLLSDRVDFAQRGLTNAYVLAVMNINRTGALECCDVSTAGVPILCSGKVSVDVLPDFDGVGFSGRTVHSCGTSIASPRIGWLLAAAEAARTKDPPAETWIKQLKKALRDSRSSGPGYSSVLFSIPRFFKMWLVQ